MEATDPQLPRLMSHCAIVLVNPVKGCTETHLEHHEGQKISTRQNSSTISQHRTGFMTKAREGWPRLDRASASSCLIAIRSRHCWVLRGSTSEACQALMLSSAGG